MDVILRSDVEKLGLRGEVVSVARGYARNYLLPRGLAEVATPALVREVEKRDASRARQEAKTIDEARAIASRIEALELRFDMNAGPTGVLFGSVTATNVAERLWDDEKIRVDRRKVGVDTIKRAGRFTVPVELFADVVAELRLVVAPEGQEPPEETPEPEAPAAVAEAAAPALEPDVDLVEAEAAPDVAADGALGDETDAVDGETEVETDEV